MHYIIFYTDDDIDDQEVFKDAVNEVSEHIQLAIQGNGTELLTVLKNTRSFPNVIFLDLNMPVKNGYDALKEIRSSDKIKDLPVVIFTTSDHAVDIESTRKLGASLFITKPSTFSLLKRILKHVLSINWETFVPSENEFVYRAN